ncbi:hypothetical protein ACGFJT_37425 [Actinomadura geliboluensis]|uniref:hypothetical protein n=1 Tax=Actinomadura geliboluensis TaxID=882440 RepID=UPI00371BAE2A
MARQTPDQPHPLPEPLGGEIHMRLGHERKARVKAWAAKQGIETTEAVRRLIDEALPPNPEEQARTAERRASATTKVRKAITENPGKTSAEIEQITGIAGSTVRHALAKLTGLRLIRKEEGETRRDGARFYPIPGAQPPETKRAL